MAIEDTSSATARVLAHHGAAMAGGNLDEIMGDYADDAVLIDPSGTARGKDAIRRTFERLLRAQVPFTPPAQHTVAGELACLVWVAAPGRPGRDGTETLVVRDGRIVAQTVVNFGAPAH